MARWSLALLVLALFIGYLFSQEDPMTYESVKAQNDAIDMSAKRAIVTGATSGIGRGIALRLAESKCSVTVLGRNKERGQAVVDEMKKLAPESSHEFVAVDAFSLKDTAAFAKDFVAKHNRLDYLVLSQGMATVQGYTATEDGLDQKLAIHYFSRIAMIQGLLPLMKKTDREHKEADVRVLSVLSGGIHSSYAKFSDDFLLKDNYSIKNAADAAGFYNDLGLDALAQQNPEVSFVHASPGFVNTNWGTEMPTPLRWAIRALQPLGKSPAKCAEFMLAGLTSPLFQGGFHAMGQHGQVVGKTKLHTPEIRDLVWKKTLEAISV